MPTVGQELLRKRTRSSKTTYLGPARGGKHRYALDSVVGILHYREDEKDESLPWLDIDLNFDSNGKIRAAPYMLDVDLEKLPNFWHRSRHSGEFNVRLKGSPGLRPNRVLPRIEGNRIIWEDLYKQVDVVVVAGTRTVTLLWIVKQEDAPRVHDVLYEAYPGRARMRGLRHATDANAKRIRMYRESILGGHRERLGELPIVFADEEAAEVLPIQYPIIDATVIGEQVGQSSDDAEQHHAGMILDNDELTLGDSFRMVGFRFTGISVPDGTTVTAAYLELYLPNAAGDDLYTNKDVYCENGNNPGTFTTGASNMSNRTLTTASTELVGGSQGTGWKNCPASGDLIDEVQEVVDDNAGTGDALVFIIDSTSYEDLDIQSWDFDDNTKGAKVHLEYTVGGVAHEKSLSDTIALADSPAKAVGKVSSDSVAVADDISKGVGKAASDAVAIAEDIMKGIGKNPSDTVAIADSFAKVWDAQLALADTVNIADTFAQAWTAYLALVDSIAIADSEAKQVGVNLSDEIAVLDELVKAASIGLADTVAIADAVSKAIGISQEDSIAIAEAITRDMTLHLADSVAITETGTFTLPVTFTEWARLHAARFQL